MVAMTVRRVASLTALLLAAGSSDAPETPAVHPSAGRPASTASARRWVPAPGTTWQWQLTVPVDLSVDAAIYDIDGFLNPATVVAELHRRGRKAICYVEVGGAENFRPDYDDWPPKLLGRSNGWPGERWLDIRDPGTLRPVLARRFDMCAAKGFDAVEPDLMDGYANDTGFPITAAHQLRFNRFVARLAHERGLSVALKNDVEQVSRLVRHFDFTINESCAVYHECAGLKPFIAAGKAVLHAEYTLPPSAYCAQSRRLRLSSLRKNRILDAPVIPCTRPDTRWQCGPSCPKPKRRMISGRCARRRSAGSSSAARSPWPAVSCRRSPSRSESWRSPAVEPGCPRFSPPP